MAWMSPGDKSRSGIDLIPVDKWFRYFIQFSKAAPDEDVGSDPISMTCIIGVKLQTLKNTKLSPKCDMGNLRNDINTRKKYAVSAQNRFGML